MDNGLAEFPATPVSPHQVNLTLCDDAMQYDNMADHPPLFVDIMQRSLNEHGNSLSILEIHASERYQINSCPVVRTLTVSSTDLLAEVVGKGMTKVRHIERQTRTRIIVSKSTVNASSTEVPHLMVYGPDNETVENALAGLRERIVCVLRYRENRINAGEW